MFAIEHEPNKAGAVSYESADEGADSDGDFVTFPQLYSSLLFTCDMNDGSKIQ